MREVVYQSLLLIRCILNSGHGVLQGGDPLICKGFQIPHPPFQPGETNKTMTSCQEKRGKVRGAVMYKDFLSNTENKAFENIVAGYELGLP